MIDSYDKLTIGKYRELMALDNDVDDVTKGINILSVLSDYTEEELYDMPLDDFSKLMAKTSFLQRNVEKTDWKKLGKQLVINGKKYDVIKEARKMTAGQYIDYREYTKDSEKFMDMLPFILTVFLIPSGMKYGNGYDTAELAQEFNDHLDIKTALSISDFFLHQSKVSMMTSILSLKWMMKRMMKKEKNQEIKEKIQIAVERMDYLESLLKSGDGFTQQ